ncbi:MULTISPECIES: amino acid permease [unclassified Sulfurospirillum]|uniref:amino acid permease n=1 Tax=unclassified Sulfurospirillum TaxID=2618290 RepID=UPI000504C5AF|nr:MULTISPECIES: amino acid permease [unclassified Sulfurospirillum]KFL34291.1 aromatic amino acid transporter [Sulfurospirillum sp. SCADC]
MHAKGLSRGLKNRHVQLIALGGAIGTGLFLGVSTTVQLTGPAVLLGYALGGFIAFMIMRQLGEMVVEEPVAGSFSHFANKYWHPFAGFASGWNYWILYVLVGMAELTAIGTFVHFWLPNIPTWASAAFFFVLVNLVNLVNVRIYGEFEFWFSIIKVAAIIAMIAFGSYLLISGNGGESAHFSNLWALEGGFFPHGIQGFLMAMVFIMFSFGGLELIGIAAAETDDPSHTIPRATNQVIYRILIFYIGALAILLSLMPWMNMTKDVTPFVMVFSSLNENFIAHVLNAIVLTAALSVYNSGVYSNSRMLFGLAAQGNAPKMLMSLNAKGVPVNAVLFSALITGLCVVLNYFMPEDAFKFLMALVVSALVVNWFMISFAHLKFRYAKIKEGVEPKFKAFWFPVGNIICLLFFVMILVIMLFIDGINISVYLIPAWIALLAVGYKLSRK